MRHTSLFILMAGLTGTAVAGGGLTIVLDDFDSDPNDELAGPRSVTSLMISNPFNQPASFGVDTGFNFEGETGAAIFNSGIGASQRGQITWDNDGAGLNLDISTMGVTGFELDFLMVDLDFRVEMMLSTTDGGTATFTDFVSAGEAQTYAIDLASFDLGDGFDAADVDEIRLVFNPRTDDVASLDFILTEVRAVVPAPGSAALLALGGLVAARRRR